MKIAILGAGGVGGYFGGRWAQAGLDVTLIARGGHLQAIRDHGLTIFSPLGDALAQVPAVESAEDVGVVDLVVVATKTWQLPAAARSIAPMVGPNTMVMGLQNGVDAADVLAGAVGRDNVIGGTCRLIAFIQTPGVVRHVGGDPALVFGELAGGSSPRTETARAALGRGAGMTVESSADIAVEIWKKLHFLAPVAGVGSVTRASVGTIRTVPQSRALLSAAMDEVVAVARAKGVALEAGLTNAALAYVDALPAESTTSLQRDFRDGKRTELDALNGALSRLGAELGVDTPVNDFIYGALLPQELRARGDIRKQ